MSSFYNKKPYIHNKTWNVFENAIFSNLDFSDCNDTIDGICHHTKNLSDCIDLCKGDCKSGYFIETPNKNYCVPLREHTAEQTSPYYRLRNKNIYPVLKDMKTFVFSKYPFPPNVPNALFYSDHFSLKNILKNMFLNISDNSDVIFTNDDSGSLQFLPNQVARNYVENYVFIKCGDEVVINIPHTALVLNENSNTISWSMRAATINVSSDIFQIYSPDKKIGEVLDYNDKFYFTFQSQPVLYDSELNILTITNKNIQNLFDSKANIFFELVPKIQVNYCENNECKQISLDKTIRNGLTATYKNFPVERSPTCWGLCKKPNKLFWIYIIITIILCIVIIKLVFT